MIKNWLLTWFKHLLKKLIHILIIQKYSWIILYAKLLFQIAVVNLCIAAYTKGQMVFSCYIINILRSNQQTI